VSNPDDLRDKAVGPIDAGAAIALNMLADPSYATQVKRALDWLVRAAANAPRPPDIIQMHLGSYILGAVAYIRYQSPRVSVEDAYRAVFPPGFGGSEAEQSFAEGLRMTMRAVNRHNPKVVTARGHKRPYVD
jgi:hypothetical protein